MNQIPFKPLNMKEATPPEQTHMISIHQHLDEVASMTYQAHQICALSSSFILRTLNWTFDLPTRHKLTVQQRPSPTNIVAQQKEPFILPHGIIYLTTHDWRWLKSYHPQPLQWESICGYRFTFWQHFIFNESVVPYPWPWCRATKQTWLLTNQETPNKGKDISQYSTFKRAC